MIRVNENYLKIQASYLFTEIAHRVKAHQDAHPEAKVIRLGIGDVTEPLAPAVVAAMHRAVDDEAARETFRGYGPEQGYDFLREAIAQNDFQAHGVDVAADELRQHPGALRAGRRHRGAGSRLSRVRGHERDGRPHRHERGRPLCRSRLP